MVPAAPLVVRIVAALLLAAAMCGPVHARERPALAEVALADLPPEAGETYARILRGGPFRYDRDGAVFGNREGMLPPVRRGYYHEYTVPTPGTKNRGARRIVCGGLRTAPEACYYTGDHYQSFRRIRQ